MRPQTPQDGTILISVHSENKAKTDRQKSFSSEPMLTISSSSESGIKGSTGTLPHPGLA
jgi:hypothetical protein